MSTGSSRSTDAKNAVEIFEYVHALVRFEFAVHVVKDLAGAALTIARRHYSLTVEGKVTNPENLTPSHEKWIFSVVCCVSGVLTAGRDGAQVTRGNHAPMWGSRPAARHLNGGVQPRRQHPDAGSER